MAGKGFLIGAVQVPGIDPPAQGNPYHRNFDLELLDAHIEAATERTLRLFEAAGKQGLDLVLGSEDMRKVSGLIVLPTKLNLRRRYCQTIPGPLTERMGSIARKHNMHIATCFYEKAGGRYYNTAVLINGGGRLTGKFRKVHLTPTESTVMTPGRSWPVFKTELGKIGFLICYDIQFSEPARCLALNGAQLLLHPTAGYGWTDDLGVAQAHVRAVDNNVGIVISCNRRSQVVNSWGDILVDAKYRKDVVVSARLDPRRRREFNSGHFYREVAAAAGIRDDLMDERCPQTYRVMTAKSPPALGGRGCGPAIYSDRRKRAIQKLLEAHWKALAAGRKGLCHWNSR